MKIKGEITLAAGCGPCEMHTRQYTTTSPTEAGILWDKAHKLGAPARVDYNSEALTLGQKIFARMSLETPYIGEWGDMAECPETGRPCPNAEAVIALNMLIASKQERRE